MSEVQAREEKYKKVNRIAVPLYLALACVALAYNAARGDRYATLQAALGIGLLPVPALLGLFRVKLPGDSRLLYYLFVFCTVIIGSSLYGYARIPYWDKIFHFLSGLLISVIGLAVYRLLSGHGADPKGREVSVALVFTALFNIAVAAIWEMYEYMLFIVFKIDAVNTLTTGVNDTMQDMIVCTVGGLLFLLSARRYFRKGKGSFLINTYRQFFALRGR